MLDLFSEDLHTPMIGLQVDVDARTPVGTPTLLVIAGPHVGELFLLRQAQDLGRDAEADLSIRDSELSRFHCRFVPLPEGGVALEDLGSTNGTFVNRRRVRRRLLEPGDTILVGRRTVLKFAYRDAIDIRFQRYMYASALRDSLTEVFNKRYFDERLEAEVAFALRHRTDLSLVMIDLDHFKRVNDTQGHLVGDAVLAQIGPRIARLLRTEDVVARYGGEEFAIISAGINLGNAVRMAERLRHHAATVPVEARGRALTVTMSLGAAALGNGIESPAQLIAAADAALYAAKAGGRDRVERHAA